LFGLAVVLSIAAPVLAAAAPRVAVLALENRSGDPRYDYIGGIAGGILLYDLSASGSVELLDRGSIDSLLKERELSLSAIAAAPAKAFDGISTADYVLAGEYVLMGGELRLTLKLVDVGSSRVFTFSETGSTENLIHALVEAIVEKLSGRRPVLVESGRERSILSLRDETPGSVALHSRLIDAEIFLDGQFAGYTTGDNRKPFMLEGLQPGVHEVSTYLGLDFGVVKLPEVSFSRWKELVRVLPGKRIVIVDPSSHFNDVIYRLKEVFSEDAAVAFDASGRYSADRAFSFVDRAGKERKCRIAVELRAPAKAGAMGSGTMTAEADGERLTLPLAWPADKETEFKATVGLVSFAIEVDSGYGRVSLAMDAERTDIEQGMHR
jgi:TolB-like protein